MAHSKSLRVPLGIVLATFAAASAIFGQVAQEPRSASRAPKAQAESAVTMIECERGNCGQWTFLSAQGRGQWPNGESANLVVSMTGDKVVVRRADLDGTCRGLTAEYTGTRDNDGLQGKFTVLAAGNCNKKSGNWFAEGVDTQSLPSAMRFCGPWMCATLTGSNGHFEAVYDGLHNGQIWSTYTFKAFRPEEVIIDRVDKDGFKAVLTGKVSPEGNRIDGTIGGGPYLLAWGTAVSQMTGPTMGPKRPQTQQFDIGDIRTAIAWFGTFVDGIELVGRLERLGRN